MAAPETPDRSSFALFGALAGMLAVGAAALLFVHSAGDPGDHAHVLRVGVAAVIGAGVGAYLGETRRQFILRSRPRSPGRWGPCAAGCTAIAKNFAWPCV